MDKQTLEEDQEPIFCDAASLHHKKSDALLDRSPLTDVDIDRIVEMAWEDRTSFDTIYDQFGVSESEVIKIMRKSMKRSSFLMWRERVSGRKTKHAKTSEAQRFRCSQQDKPKSKN